MRRSLPRCRLHARVLAAFGLAVGAVVFAAAPARAEVLPTVVVHRTDDTADCPDAAGLAARVARHMKHAALEPRDSGAASLDVQIYRSEKGYTAVVQTGAKTRQLIDEGPTCAGLGDALAITLAILLDTEVPPPPPSPDPPFAPPPALPPLRPAEIAPPAPPPPAPLPAPPERPFSVYAGAGITPTVGLIHTPMALGASAFAALGVGRTLSFEAGVLAIPTQTAPYLGRVKGADPTGTLFVDLNLNAGLVRACAGLPAFTEGSRAGLCLGPVLGAIHGEGRGFPTNRTATVPWLAAAADAFYVQPLFWRISVAARATFYLPILRQKFTVADVSQGDDQAFTPAPAAGALDAELRLSIW